MKRSAIALAITIMFPGRGAGRAHKDAVLACVRAPGPDGRWTSTVRRFRTFTAALNELRARLIAEGVKQVAMEATGA